MRHTHDWCPAAPIDPVNDPGNLVARIGHEYTKTQTFACACGATRMTLTTNGFRNFYISRPGGQLWRGRRH